MGNFASCTPHAKYVSSYSWLGYGIDPLERGFLVPDREQATAKFFNPLLDDVAKKMMAGTLKELIPEVQDLKTWVTEHSEYRIWVTSMIEEVNAFITSVSSETKQEIKLAGGTTYIEGFDSLFILLNEIVTTTPSFNETAQVGTPMNGLLAVSMATENGLALFHSTAFNLEFKKVLNAWNKYLKTKESLDLLDIQNPEKKGSWISQKAWKAGVWDQMVILDKNKNGYGYDSWNSFFTRPFVKGARPFKGNDTNVINIGCETSPFAYKDNAALQEDFWIKSVKYSLVDIFGGRQIYAKLFEGGQIYQGFLSATRYHRWNSPVTGHIVRSWVQQGTYFAQRPKQGQGLGTWEGTESQAYLGHVQTRAIFIFKHKRFNFVAMVLIGMVEVSSCVIESKFIVDGHSHPVEVTRGTEIGHFEFGGSTHILMVQRGRAKFAEWARKIVQRKNPVHLGSIIGTLPVEENKDDVPDSHTKNQLKS